MDHLIQWDNGAQAGAKNQETESVRKRLYAVIDSLIEKAQDCGHGRSIGIHIESSGRSKNDKR